jgi:hypothetical protein
MNRSDKGKSHRYPAQRRHPALNSSVNVKETNLSISESKGKVVIMKPRYKGSPAMREYWRKQKAEQRKKEAAKA